MKMKLSEIKTRHQGLLNIANKQLTAKLAYAIAKNIRKLDEEVKLIEKQRITMAESFAEKDENENPIIENGKYKLSDENEKKFSKECDEFLAEEIEVEIYTIPETVLEIADDPRYDLLTPANMLVLDFMIRQNEENK